MKGKHSESKRAALAVLEDREICTTGAILKRLQETAIRQISLIRTMERESALRALLVGLALHRIKAGLYHGEFMPWLKGHVDGVGYRSCNYYMRLATAFVEATHLTKPELLALPADQTEFAIEPADAAARRFMDKAAKFVGDCSLNELLAREHVKDHKPLGGARPAKKDTRTEEEKLAELREIKRAELASWITTGRQLLIDENVCQFLPREEIEAIHGQLLDLKTEFTKAIQPLLKKHSAA
jgi:hypothetical protein